MIASLRQLFRPRSARRAFAVPPGKRVYAIGDIHGRSDLFKTLIAAIDADDAASAPAQSTVILLGDLVDRGADSAGVIAAARAWSQRREVQYLVGNHEEQFLAALHDAKALRGFLRIGGRETVLSYAVDPAAFARADIDAAHALIRKAVSPGDIEFLAGGLDAVVIGDYLFVHAGIRPGVDIGQQSIADLRWIRSEFTSSQVDHPQCVVHGHTIAEEVELRHNRIGIDTGAFYTGRLTALRLEGTGQAILQTTEGDGGIVVETRRLP
jgi:serine/threonine protein phosphatase 1